MKAIRKTFNQADTINRIAEECDVSKVTAKAMLNTLSDIVEGHMKPRSCGEYSLLGLVKLERKKRKARKGRNPQTGEAVKIAAKTVPTAKPLGRLKNIVSGN